MKNGIGMIYSLDKLLLHGPDVLFDLDLDCVQLVTSNPKLYTKENAARVLDMLGNRLRISSFWAGWSGPQVWDFQSGPQTLGIVPTAYRAQRLEELVSGADFAKLLGVTEMATHVGFIPENPSTDAYHDLRVAVQYIADYCKTQGIHFNFESGQETPVTLMRLITDLNNDYVGINMDPANLIMYGKANPVDAARIFGKRIRGMHIKDADYTSDFYHLGPEKVVGTGSVNFPKLLQVVLEIGYEGDFYIEREITGEQQLIDIRNTIDFLRQILHNMIPKSED